MRQDQVLHHVQQKPQAGRARASTSSIYGRMYVQHPQLAIVSRQHVNHLICNCFIMGGKTLKGWQMNFRPEIVLY